MKIKILLLVFLSIIIFVSSITVRADFLPPGMKQVGTYIRLEGWESVKDYWIVQPILSNWSECRNGRRNFYLLESGNACNFGSEGHCMEYYYPVAIPKNFTADIVLEKKAETAEYQSEYSISCDSDSYKSGIATKTIIPHTNETFVIDTDPLLRIDYLVTFSGVDQINKELLVNVSEPIKRQISDKNEADSFAKILAVEQPLSVTNNYPIPTEQFSQPAQDIIKDFKEDSQQSTNVLLSKNWYFAATLSVILLVVVLIVIAKRQINITKDRNKN